jgi:hypothetical protein
MNIEVGKYYHLSSMTEPVEVTAGHDDGSFTVRSINLFNEVIEWGLTPDMFRREANAPRSRRQLLPELPPEITKQLVHIDKPLVLGCFVSWSELDQAWEVVSARTGESVYLRANGQSHCSPGVPRAQWDAAIRHAMRCLDAIKAVV